MYIQFFNIETRESYFSEAQQSLQLALRTTDFNIMTYIHIRFTAKFTYDRAKENIINKIVASGNTQLYQNIVCRKYAFERLH